MYVRYAIDCARMKARHGTTASLHFNFSENCCVLLFQKIMQRPKTTLDPVLKVVHFQECRNDFQVHGIYASYVYGCLRIVESISRTVVCSLSVRYVVCGRTCVLCISKCVLFVCIVRKVCKCIVVPCKRTYLRIFVQIFFLLSPPTQSPKVPYFCYVELNSLMLCTICDNPSYSVKKPCFLVLKAQQKNYSYLKVSSSVHYKLFQEKTSNKTNKDQF